MYEKSRKWLPFVTLAVMLLVAAPAHAQTAVSSSDIQRLQDDVYQASSEVARLRTSDPNLHSRLQTDLDDLRDEVTYLKVKLRREGSVTRADYTDVRNRLQDLRARARGETPTEQRGTWTGGATGGVPGGTSGGVAGGTSGGVAGGVPGGTAGDVSGGVSGGTADARTTRPQGSAIPVGQEIDVRLQSKLSSDTAQVEDRFEATTVVDLYEGNRVLIPAGSVMRGIVRTVNPATRTDRKGEMTVSFDQVTVSGRTYPMRGTVTQAIESEGIKGEIGKIGVGAGVGAIIGGIIGGGKGALLGVLIGSGGTIAATPGKDVTLEPGTILRVRLDSPPEIR